ncbi:Six-hairpin glycosidase-like protein [Yarrowia lipolytica]|jgi:glucoamylase|nr:Six-hairpin glycosidase-like protein [Yarrowia lipolytica]KAE8171522.1 Six-hairpin glycosidase-like protein [Yarrowia lipolytica]QNQ00339.1 Glucoamylase GLU1 [Yarrowia lipolytica]RMI98193.1 Six-hairpin glycosidase-like protein [Yarrowia lipolytica]
MLLQAFVSVLALPGSLALPLFDQKPLLLAPYARPNVTLIDAQKFELWLAQQTHHAFESVLDNVGHQGSNNGLPVGVVIASPSKTAPDYYYQWTRDAAITMDSVVRRFYDQASQGILNDTLSNIIMGYIETQGMLQHVSNPSGYFDWNRRVVSGLGEPKFETDGSAFTGHWGRPQNDGPALRIKTISHYIQTQVEWNETASLDDYVYIYKSMILPDVEYILQYWDQPTFDLWEELEGYHLFTSQVQFNALINVVELARHYSDRETESRCTFTAGSIRQFIKTHFEAGSRLNAQFEPRSFGRSGLDSSIFLAALDSVRWESSIAAGTSLKPYDDLLIATIMPYVHSFDYPINHQRLAEFEESFQDENPGYVAVGVGRYAEDVYDGVGTSHGNPWFICTATIAETIFFIAHHLAQQSSDFVLEINSLTKEFYGTFVSSDRIARDSEEYQHLLDRLVDLGDSFLDVIREHQANNGDMSEQFNRYDGFMQGAEKLTWSYGSFWSAVRARQEVIKGTSGRK